MTELNQEITKSNREGFGKGLQEIGEKNPNVVVLCADLTSSTKADKFAAEFPDRFIQVGIAEQNMAGIAAGLALSGKIPFIVSHAIFSPSRNWDQIRMSICLSKANVKIVGSHSGFSNGPDGAVMESLEDLALMRVLPGMTVIQPTDANEARNAVAAVVDLKGPVYLRISKAETPLITSPDTPFVIEKAHVLQEGNDVTLIASGPITIECLLAARELRAKYKIEAEVIVCPTIKPLDEDTIIESAKKTKKVFTVEEHQIIGGLGSAVAELLSEKFPVTVKRLGMKDCFGMSGTYQELKDKFGISSHNITKEIWTFLQ